MIININKPKGITSRDVVNKVCKFLGTKKVGHTGTLDPLATGVLIVCVNQATKLVEILTCDDKEYTAEIKLGIKTDTGDITGNIIEEKEFNINVEQINNVFNKFIGTQLQTVPIYSAVKVNGKKLYEYARNNIDVELPKREVTIKDIELLNFEKDLIKFKVSVSKGTYIRSLIEDICENLDTVGTMNNLIRTRQGSFKLEEANELEDILNNNYNSISVKEALSNYKMLEVPMEYISLVKNGAIIPKIFSDDKIVFLHDEEVIAIYQTYHKDEKKAKPFKMFK